MGGTPRLPGGGPDVTGAAARRGEEVGAMLAILLALGAAAGFGGSDFAAGLAARGDSVIRVTVLAELTAAVLGLLTLPWTSAHAPSLASVAWAGAGGISGVAGAIALYLGFRHASFSVASSLSAVSTAALSVVAGVLLGDRLGALSLAGIALALPAIAAVSASPGQPRPDGGALAAGADPVAGAGAVGPEAVDAGPGRATTAGEAVRRPPTGRHITGAAYGLAAGACFAAYFVGLDQAGSRSGLWPVLVAQLAGLAAAGCAAALTRQLRLPHGPARPLAAVTGVTGLAGTLCLFLSARAGLLAVAAVITSLYPAATILLARLLLRERLTPTRLVGLCLAAASVALITAAGRP